MLLSIIIPVYNNSKHLTKCLNSIIECNLHFFEIIIIDDFSTDNSWSIIKAFQQSDNRIKIFKNKKNCKAGYTRNRGINEATGDYIWFVDSDDWLDSGSLKTILHHLKKENNEFEVLLFGHTEYFVQNENLIKRERLPLINGIIEDAFENFLKLTNGFLTNPFKYIFSKKFIMKHNILFPEDVYFEDILFVTKALFFSKKVYALQKSFYNYNFIPHESMLQTASKEKIFSFFKNYIYLYQFLIENKAFNVYSNLFTIRFIIFGFGTCLEMYTNLTKKEQEDDDLINKLESYFHSDMLSKENLNLILKLINEISEDDSIIKYHYIKKLDTIKYFKNSFEKNVSH